MQGSVSDSARLAVLRSLTFLTDAGHHAFSDITTLAAHLLDAPMAHVTFVEQAHVWTDSCYGSRSARAAREDSFCTHAIDQQDSSKPFVVIDAAEHPTFCGNPHVTGQPNIRMYVGVPLIIDGQAIGSLCVLDTKPREPTELQLQSLTVLARNVVTLIEAKRGAEALRNMSRRNRLILDAAIDAVITFDAAGRVLTWNSAADALFGFSHDDVAGRTVAGLISPNNAAPMTPTAVCKLMTGGTAAKQRFEVLLRREDDSDFIAEVSLAAVPDGTGVLHTAFVRDLTRRIEQESERRESETRDVVIFAMARLAESRDPETGAHIERVQRYCMLLAEQLRVSGVYADLIDDEFLRLLPATSPLHDIGKVGIPDEVLLKPGPLTPAEFEVMKTHTTIGCQTLEAAMERFPNTRFLRMARNIAATHHEKFNGTGYPKGLKGTAIPLCGRIVALADVYDALTSRRVYKSAMGHETARTIIVAESGRHFDPNVVEAFLAVEAQFRTISKRGFNRSIAA